ncbi:MAG: TolC family protein [Bacteroidota bacterium]
MKKIFLLIMLSTILNAQNKVLSLKESIELGLQNSKDIKLSQSKLNLADAKLSEINSQFLPQFKLFGNYTRLSDNIPAFEVQLPSSPNPFRISSPIYDNYNLRFGFSQPIFTGLKLISLKSSAKNNLKASLSELSKEENEAAFNIYNSYWNYYKAEEIKKLISQSLKQIEAHLNNAKNFYENGLISKNDFLKLEVQYSNTKLMLIEAEKNSRLAQIMFNKSIGVDLNTGTSVKGDEIIELQITDSLQDILAEALNQREELKSLSYRINASKDLITSAKSNWFPSLYLNGNYYYSNPNPRFQPAKSEFNYNWEVGVTLSWDIWNWGLTSSQTRQAEESKIQLEVNKEQLSENIQQEVYSNYLDLVKNREKVLVNKETLNQATENYRITAEKFNVQIASSTDLIDAETLKLQAETNLKSAEIDFQISKIKLDKSLGRRIY